MELFGVRVTPGLIVPAIIFIGLHFLLVLIYQILEDFFIHHCSRITNNES